MSVNITRAQAAQLLDLFGGEDGLVTLDDSDGLRAYFTEHPEEGSVALDAADDSGVKEVPNAQG